jgi:alkanesulfonate monooxygenase SsuD/methylene tetrahydromethanopterin reductase-like flavin-dependent oxidoreductase (luciferase family)
VTLDHLSRGRLTFGVGLGNVDDLEPFQEVVDRRERARLLDQGLSRLTELWSGEFQPLPLQRPRIPIWVAANWPHRRPVRRAARWDGLFPIDLPGAHELAELAQEIEESRRGRSEGPFDLAVEIAPGADPGPWRDAGATWVLTAVDPQQELEVRDVIEAGPH